jgi:hypothetical protein
MWGTSDRESGELTVPTHETCEALRETLESLPPLAHGMLVVGSCRESSMAAPALPEPSATGPARP